MSDHYSTLGVDRNADADQIKRAYRKMASQHHPDKGGDTAKFQQVEEAYRVLSDPNSRAQYDNPQPQFQQGGFPGGHPFGDIFRHFGGNPFGDIFGHHHQQPRNRTLTLSTNITLEEAFSGKELLASMKFPGDNRDRVLDIKIPAGIQNGTVLRLSGMGEDIVPGAPRGDIHLTVNVLSHNKFIRQGDDLIQELSLPVWSGILGSSIDVETIDGRIFEMKIPAGAQNDQIFGIQDAGMPNMNDPRFKGRLLLKIKFVIPNNLTDQQKELIRQAIA